MKIVVISSPCECKHEGACDGVDYSEMISYIPCCPDMKRLFSEDPSVRIRAGLCGGTVSISGMKGNTWWGYGEVKHCPFCGNKVEQITIQTTKRDAVDYVQSTEGWYTHLKKGESVQEPIRKAGGL